MELLKMIVGELKKKKQPESGYGEESPEKSDKVAQLKGMIEKAKAFAEDQCGMDSSAFSELVEECCSGEGSEGEVVAEAPEAEEGEDEGMGQMKAMKMALMKAKMKKMAGKGSEEV